MLSSKNFVTVIYGSRLRCLCSQCLLKVLNKFFIFCRWQGRNSSVRWSGTRFIFCADSFHQTGLWHEERLFAHVRFTVYAFIFYNLVFLYFRKLLTLVSKRLKTKESHAWQCWRMSWSNHNTNRHLPSLNVMMTLLGGKKLLYPMADERDSLIWKRSFNITNHSPPK